LRVIKQRTINVPLICLYSEEQGTKNCSTKATAKKELSVPLQPVERWGRGPREGGGEERDKEVKGTQRATRCGSVRTRDTHTQADTERCLRQSITLGQSLKRYCKEQKARLSVTGLCTERTQSKLAPCTLSSLRARRAPSRPALRLRRSIHGTRVHATPARLPPAPPGISTFI